MVVVQCEIQYTNDYQENVNKTITANVTIMLFIKYNAVDELKYIINRV